jgi:hypothetical protein
MINFFKKKKEFIAIFCISFFLFFVKWTLSLYFFNDEDLSIRVINESSSTFTTFDSYNYFHYIKSLADFNFKSLYDPDLQSDYYLLIPYGSVIFHSIFYKLVGNTSFILLEFLAIFLFITIFYLIFRLINFSKNLSILLPVIFYTLPDFLHFFNYFNIIEIRSFSGNFYSLRFPRPLVSNLFFFAFIYILIQSHIKKNLFTKKNLFSLSIIFGMTLSSFFFLFLTIAITFILYLLIYFKKNIFQIINLNLKKIIYSLILFILIILPFIFLLYFTNPDYSERMGIIEITLTDKFFLINHYFYKLFRLKLILVYIVLFFSYLFMKKFNYENLKYVYIFYILFVSSIIAPFVFIIFSNKIAFLYHLNNTVVVCLVLLILMFFLVNVNLIIKKIKINFKNEYLTISVISIIIIIHNFNIFHNYKKDIDNHLRIERSKIINILLKDDSIDISKSKILTFDRKIMTWSLFKDNRDLYIIDGTFTIRDNSLIENDLINLFKFFELSEEDFLKFISNKKIGYRYNNPVLKDFFWQKYTANSFYTFKRSKDFEKETLNFIAKSSPFYSHQFAIPKFEIDRMIKKFRSNSFIKKDKPDIIILNKNSALFKKMIIEDFYCKKFDGKALVLYISYLYCN